MKRSMMKKVQACVASESVLSISVPSSSSDAVYQVTASVGDGGVSCSCPGFQFRKTCKHVSVETRACGWIEGVSDENQNGRQHSLKICPKCGSKTEVIMYGEPLNQRGVPT